MAAIDYSPLAVGRLAGSLGFRRGPLEKALRLVGLLEEISEDSYLQSRLALKGGTALNLFLMGPARLSIDADLDYVGAVERDRMLKERPRVVGRIMETAEGLGYRAETVREPHALTEIHLRYRSSTGADEFLKVDLNFLERVPILGRIDRRACALAIPGERVDVPCLPAEEVAGMKLATLCIRGAPRDLFDVARLDALKPDASVVRKVALFGGFLHSLSLEGFDPSLAAAIRPKDVDDQVGPLSGARKPLSFEELLRDASAWTGALLPLHPEEVAFKEGLLDGVFDPSRLFGNIAIHPRLKEHPGIRLRLEGPVRR